MYWYVSGASLMSVLALETSANSRIRRQGAREGKKVKNMKEGVSKEIQNRKEHLQLSGLSAFTLLLCRP
jgi:hypothetical protein